MPVELLSEESTSTNEVVAALVAKFQQKLENLAADGKIKEGAALTQFDIRVEYAGGAQVEWVADNGDVFCTRSNSREFTRPMAPAIPTAVKKLLEDQSEKAVTKAKDAVRKLRLGSYAMRETRLCSASNPRTLPGITGYTYSADREIAELQKYAHAGDKIGL